MYYIGETAEDYNRAVAFAASVLAENDPLPSKINMATSMLVESWKDLAEAGDYSKVIASVAAAKDTYEDPNTEINYTPESYRAFAVAYNEALRAVETKPYAASENETINKIADDLDAALAGLEEAGSDTPSAPTVGMNTTTDFEGMMMYPNEGYGMFFTPMISEGTITPVAVGQTLEDGTPVDAYIVGFGVSCLYTEDSILAAFDYSNCNVTVTPPTSDAYSTGTVVQFTDDNGNVVATYIVVVIGDVNNDNVYNSVDDGLILMNENYVIDWMYGDKHEQYNLAAGDITNDGMTDSTDAGLIAAVDAYLGTINQEVDPNGETSFIYA